LADQGGCPCFHFSLLGWCIAIAQALLTGGTGLIPFIVVLENSPTMDQVASFTVIGGFEEVHGMGHLQTL
jgi:hypothetical protein